MVSAVIERAVNGLELFPDMMGNVLDLIDQHYGLTPDVFEIGEEVRNFDYHALRISMSRLERKRMVVRDDWKKVITSIGRARLCKFRNHQRFRCLTI